MTNIGLAALLALPVLWAAEQTTAAAQHAPAVVDTVHVPPPTGEAADRANILAVLEQVRPGGTVQFAAGTYLVGEGVRVTTPRVTLLGHRDGTTLRGCDPALITDLRFLAFNCNGLQLEAGQQAVRDITFEHAYAGVYLGPGMGDTRQAAREGGDRVEGNTFRTGYGIIVDGDWADPSIVRGNRFINTFHGIGISGGTVHLLDNHFAVPQPELAPIAGFPSDAVMISPRRRPPGDTLAATCGRNVIAGNHIEGSPYGIQIAVNEPGSSCRGTVIRDNTIEVRRVRSAAPGRLPAGFGWSDESDSTFVGVPIVLHNYTMKGDAIGSDQPGIIEDSLIEGNRIIGAEGPGMHLHHASRNRIVNNTFTDIRLRDPFPGHTIARPEPGPEANGAGIWVSPGSDENEITGNIFNDVASHAIVLEGDRNRVETRSGGDAVRDAGSGNLASRPDPELAAIVREYQGEHDRFGVLFARYDGVSPAVRVAGDVRPADHLRLASVSKVFLSFMFLRDGPSPDATIEAFHPRDRFPHSDVITARMLLGHTSGIPDEMGRRIRELSAASEPGDVLRALGHFLAAPMPDPDTRTGDIYNHDVGLDFAPGEMWCYSNPGYLVLGRILERVTGQPVDRLLARHFGEIAPSLYLDDGREARFPDSYLDPWPIHWSHPWVAGGLVARAADALAAFHHVSEQPEFVTMQAWTTAPRCPADVVFGDAYGLGVQRYDLDGIGEAIGHDGHITARTVLLRLGDASYLIHTTRPVTNPELRTIVQRLLASRE